MTATEVKTGPLGCGVESEALERARAEPLYPPWTRAQWITAAVVAASVLLYPAVFTQPYMRHIMVMVFIYGLMAQGWNVLAGYCGQISLGHAFFFGIGAYSAGYLFTHHGITPWAGMGVGVVISVVAAALIGFPTFRLRGHYFAIATLVIGESAHIVFLNWETVGAATGLWIPVERDAPLRDMQFHESKAPNYYIGLAFLTLATAIVYKLERSKIGFYLRAVREDPEAAQSLGVDVTRCKMIAIMISAALTSVAGTLYAQYTLIIDPETVLPLLLSILVVLMTMLGGLGTLWGPIIGAAVLVPLSEATRVWLGGTGGAEDLMIYGALITIIAVCYPSGLIGLGRRLLERRR
jgi:branched-chain amino acid transport system permease protein